jgi:phosphatidylinositol 4-kinase
MNLSQEQWPALVRRAWRISPAAAVHMGERFKIPQVQVELARLIKSHPRAVIDVPEALHFLLGDQLETSAVPALKVSPPDRLIVRYGRLNGI